MVPEFGRRATKLSVPPGGMLTDSPFDDAAAYATRKGGGRKRPATGWASLTPAELGVVRLVSEGLRNDAIARHLFIAPSTVKVQALHHAATVG